MAHIAHKIGYYGYNEISAKQSTASEARCFCVFKIMNLKEIAKQYRDNAAMLLKRIGELKAQDVSQLSCTEQVRHEGRIRMLESLYAESMSTAHYLDNYYRT